MIRVLIIDDHPDVGGALADTFGDDPSFLVLGHYARAEEALREMGTLNPHVVVIDHGMPDLSGVQICERVLRRRERVRVVVLTSYVRETVALTAFDAGAAGVVVKSSDGADIRRAVRTVAAGGVYIDPLLAGRIVDRAVQHHVDTEAASIAPAERRA